MTPSVDRALISRSLHERLPVSMKAGFALALYAFMGSWIYSGFAVDFDSFLVDFPEELTALMGGDLVGATGGYVGSVMFNLIGPLVFVGLAVTWGAGAIAGEESAHTARLLFAQPITRRQVLVDRSVVIVVAVAIGVAGFAASLWIAASLFDQDPPTVANAVAAGLHLTAFAAAMGMLALAVGSGTGSRLFGVVAGGGLAAASYFIDAFAPLTSADSIERFTPWHLYNGSEPIDNGIEPAHLAIQILLAAVFLVIGLWAVDRRDLEGGAPAVSAKASAVASLVTQRVSSVFVRTVSVRAIQAGVVAAVLVGMAVSMSLLFESVGSAMDDLDLPASLENAFGGSALGSAVGWMNAEFLSVVAPLAVLGLAIAMGLDAVAGERERRTLLVVLSVVTSRRRFLVEKLLAMTVIVATSALAGLVGLLVGSAIADLELDIAGIIGAALHLGMLGLFFGTVATTAGVLLPRRTALGVATGLAVASFLSQALLSAVDGPAWLIGLSPWEYFIGSNPLANGPALTDLAVLAVLTLVTAAAGLVAFDRVDAA